MFYKHDSLVPGSHGRPIVINGGIIFSFCGLDRETFKHSCRGAINVSSLVSLTVAALKALKSPLHCSMSGLVFASKVKMCCVVEEHPLTNTSYINKIWFHPASSLLAPPLNNPVVGEKNIDKLDTELDKYLTKTDQSHRFLNWFLLSREGTTLHVNSN